MTFIFESDRLLIRSWQPKTDAELAFSIYGAPEIARWLSFDNHDALEANLSSLFVLNYLY